MKKLLSVLIVLMLVLGLTVTCVADIAGADDIEDTMTSADGTYELAFITDVGQLKDKSFNQGTWNGVKSYAAEHGLSYKYYQPANGDQATDDDRYDAIKAAVDGGAKVAVCAGYMQGAALTKAADEFKDTMFVFIDGWPLTGADGNIMSNVAPVVFKEEQCGYFAGYALVKEGFEKIGFCGGGGGTNPACCRYGYGFAQGIDAAAAELGKTVDLNYSWLYGATFSASPELQTMVNGWYENGIEVVFACGGPMFDSITAAAAENDCFVVGVDSDQSYDSDTVVTSALKGVGEAAYLAIAKYYDGNWDEIAGTGINLGAAEGATGLPTETWSMQTYTVEEYEDMLAAVIAGELAVDDNYENLSDEALESVNLSIVE
ncbi:MAG: BMP family ABC transporter substrate-binding protein [Clostridiales bacterium]|jgi:basic membrane protein A|nr:BMP family ABC transporter substrate-binding protein [Bacillota bacterium]NLL53830.1 BMP family ABC transporter substrate-binding protein [Clostridiales bacterium]